MIRNLIMKTIKRILVATDFSENSQFAILRAVELAKANKAHLTILHIAKKRFTENVIGKVIPVLAKVLLTPEEYAASLLQQQIETLSKNKVKIKYAIITGDHPAPKILNYTKEHRFDLLVLGAHGKYSIHDWFVGTTAEYVAKKTQLPVLIIKKQSNKPYRKILVPIDFSTASKNALQFVTQLVTKANFHLLHVGDHSYEELLKNEKEIPKAKVKTMQEAILFRLREYATNFIKKCNNKLIKAPCDIKLGYPGAVIINEAKRLNQDLVVMGTEGHSQRRYLFIGRVASRVLIEIDRDILLVPPKKT